MSKRVIVGDAEFLTSQDFARFTSFPQAALDRVVGDAVGWPAGWAGITVARKSAQEVTVSPGRYVEGEIVYETDEEQVLNLTVYLPMASSDEKFVALILRGTTEELNEERAFETSTDVDVSEPVASQTPVVEHRTWEVVVQQGVAAPAPALKPEIAGTDACIAYVRLTTQGVQDIEPGDAWRVKPLYEVEGRVTTLEIRFDQISARTETLETGMANVNASIDQIRAMVPRREIIREMRRDIAAMARQIAVPEGARSAFYDPGLVLEQWDTTHVHWAARIDEGVQMPFAQAKEARLEIKNEDDPNIRIIDRRMVPAFTEVKRIFNEGGRTKKLISQLTHTEIEAVKRTVRRTATEYGPTVNVCENMAEWSRYAQELHAGAKFTKNGETIEVVANLGEIHAGLTGHTEFAVRSVKTVTYTDTYWDYQPKTVGLNGSTYGQTILVDQPLICPAIELELASVGSDGAIYVLFCETDATGAPKVNEVIAVAELPHADLKIGWNRFEPDLTYFAPGKRYAWYVVTTGNHQIYGTDNNAFTGGTSFRFTDGIWAQGDLTFDFNFRVYGCRFTNTRTVVEFKSMTLSDGMTQFKLLYPNWQPEGTAIAWEIQPVLGGEDHPWSPLVPSVDDNPLAGLPAMVNLRCTMLATPDLAPMIELSADAVYQASRIASSFRAVSKELDLGISSEEIETLTVVDDFDPALHTFSPRILVGNDNTLVEPDITTVVVDEDKPSRRSILSTYTVSGGTTKVRAAPGGATSNVVKPFFIQNTALFAL